MSKRFLFTLFTLIVIGILASAAIFFSKGYRISPKDGAITGTGILSVTSTPDQASVYLDSHLTIATNANVNSLLPKTYDVKITKEGFIPWEKKVEIKEGLVTEIKATLFRSIPTVYPLTYSGINNLIMSPDNSKILYVIPGTTNQPANQARLDERKGGVWIWDMSSRGVNFARGNDQRQVAISRTNLDFTKATFRWSPDSTQIIATIGDTYYLIDPTRLNDPPRDITATVQPTLTGWDTDEQSKNAARIASIKNIALPNTASGSAHLRWSADETKLLYCVSCEQKKVEVVPVNHEYKVVDLITQKTYNLAPAIKYDWLPDSEHLFMTENYQQTIQVDKSNPPSKPAVLPAIVLGKISVMEFDGFNKSEIYAGNFDLKGVYAWPDGSRLIFVSSLPTVTASEPNLFGINLK